MYQDMRAAYRKGGEAAIVPPIPEKRAPRWLSTVWQEVELALQSSDTWVVCGYSAPAYDAEVLRLLQNGAQSRPVRILLMSPDSESQRERWNLPIPNAEILPLLGLPEGIRDIADKLSSF